MVAYPFNLYRYVHAVFTSKEGVVDDVEFLFSNPREDATVVVRSASRAINLDDNDRNRKRLEEIRKSLTWEQVTMSCMSSSMCGFVLAVDG